MAVGRAPLALVVFALVIASSIVACGSSTPSVRGRFDAAHVEVDIRLEKIADETTIVAEFRPLEDGLHLYGLDLPVDGINGTGRPTRVDVVDAGWRAIGPAQPSVVAEAVSLLGFDEPFPVYPDGPVTLRQAIASNGDSDDGRIDLAITFMACSAPSVCFAPIERHAMSLPSG
ncbi:MAG TPA: hypothetical protein VFY18_09175 [Candidatus Limnocylindrales bacterium]|nr:hypothetical protein [Candidatus Limnocylindrales bacterium]